jgi:hypothetical protein
VACFLFVNSSGRQVRVSPYEVLSGVIVQERDVWNLAQAMVDAEVRHFGRRFSTDGAPPRARQLLKTKTFRLAAEIPALPAEQRRELARACLERSAEASKVHLAALSQAKLAYVSDVLELAARYRCKYLASIVARTAPRPHLGHLRKDYAYLFERFFYSLDDSATQPLGLIVCGEHAGPLAHQLKIQIERYFRGTLKGRQRASLVLAEPLVAGGELACCLELAGLVAYITSWAFRTKELVEPARYQLSPYKEQVRALRYRAVRDIGDNPNFVIWGFAVIPDLRMREDRDAEA